MLYLDNAATSVPLKDAADLASVYFEKYFNPSALYSGGIEVASFIKEAKEFVTNSVCPSGYECVFTSGGTEADNTAVFSFAKRGNAVTTSGEHSAIYEPFRELSARGLETRFAKLNADGSVNVDDLLSKTDAGTSFVSVVHVNNETGAVNDINEIAAQIKKINPKAVFHSDGVQAFGKIPFRLSSNVDTYSVSAHKIGALKGTGALIKTKRLKLYPLIFGGGQENGMRSGTENVPGIAAFYRAAQIRYSAVRENYSHALKVKKTFLSGIDGQGVKVVSPENGSPYIVCIIAAGLRGEVLQHMLEKQGVIVGTGSACAARHRHSRILTACGYTGGELEGVLRVSFSPETEEADAVFAAEKINEAINSLKKVIG
ncbi:MAG: cysteine desulfurase [Clostridia bacterium]|nr:cysteine desulfurase [Clostridia bacterium]